MRPPLLDDTPHYAEPSVDRTIMHDSPPLFSGYRYSLSSFPRLCRIGVPTVHLLRASCASSWWLTITLVSNISSLIYTPHLSLPSLCCSFPFLI